MLINTVKGIRPIRETVKLTVLLSLILIATLTSSVYAQDSFPTLSGRIVDVANLLTPAEETALSEKLAAHEADTSNQLVIATIPDLNGADIADYANRLGRFWEIGTSEEDNGVLLVVAPNARKVRIEVGYGLEGALTDALSSVIIQQEILPLFRKSDYPQGINNGVDAIIKAIAGEYTAPATGVGNSGTDEFSKKYGNFIPLIFIAIVGLTEFLKRSGYRKASKGAFPAGFGGLFMALASGNLLIGLGIAIAIFLLIYFKGSDGGSSGGSTMGPSVGGGFGGGGFGGGGFSGGGGSFGGGGASGSW